MNRRTALHNSILIPILARFGNNVTLSAEDTQENEKSCIFIWLGGGASVVDLWNPCMDSSEDYRSVFGSIQTKTGYHIGGKMENLAKISDKFSLAVSLKHSDGNHGSATHWMMSSKNAAGMAEGGTQKDPSYGSIVSRRFGENRDNGVPTYVKIDKIQYADAAWLGSRHTGYENDSESIKNMKLGIPKSSFDRRLDIVRHMEKDTQNLSMRQWSDLRETAYKMMTGDTADSFNINKESEATRLKYNIEKSPFGKSLLTAKRLIKSGAKHCTVSIGGFDTHTDIVVNLGKLAIEIDYQISNLISDLAAEGMLKNTLVVVCSEFSRTKIDKTQPGLGRHHWPSTNFCLLAGGSYGDNLIGTTDKTGLEVTSSAYYPKDLCRTIMNHFDISPSYRVVDIQNRPRYLVEEDSRVIL